MNMTITIRDAVNDQDFNIAGLNADNFERRLKLRLSEIDTEERREPKINTLQEAKKQVADILYNNARAV